MHVQSYKSQITCGIKSSKMIGTNLCLETNEKEEKVATEFPTKHWGALK